MLRIFSVLLAVIGLSGCGWIGSHFVGTDNLPAPTPLTPLPTPLPVTQHWRDTRSSSGMGDRFAALRPAAQDGRVFIAGQRGDVSALDVSSGDVLWRMNTQRSITAGVGLSEDLVLVGTLNGEVIALEQRDGSERWRTRVSSEVLAPPVGAEGVVIVRSADGTFAALQANDGTRLWAHNTTLPVLTLRGASTPLLAEGLMIAGLDDGRLLLLELATGRPIGERRLALPSGRTEVERLVDIDADPQLWDQTLYAVAYQGALGALDIRTGELLWSREFSAHAGLAVDARAVYLPHTDGEVWALNRRNGEVLWRQPDLRGRQPTAPALVGSHIVLGDFAGYIHWLDAATGTVVARIRTDNDGIVGIPVVAGNKVLLLGRSGRLDALSLSTP